MNSQSRFAASLLLASLPAACGNPSVQRKGPAAPQEVTVLTIHRTAVALETELPGRTDAVLTAEIRPQVTGVILKRLFVEGSEVKAGQQLYEIDPASYKATYDSDLASLAKAEASEASAASEERRYKPLSDADAISKQDYDNAVASEGEAVADIASARASIESARINLVYTRVLSPLSGFIGRSSVTEGALVTADQTSSLATVTQLDPIYVDFTQSSALRLRLRQEIAAGQLRLDANGEVPIQLILEDGSTYSRPGELQFSEVTVTETTGTFVVRGLVANPQHLLLPGMFVRGVLSEGTDTNAFLVPQVAVGRNSHGDATVMVVGRRSKIQEVLVHTTRTSGADWVVDKGLADGDRIVVSGLQMIRPGMPVHPIEQSASAPTGAVAVSNPT